MATLKIEAQEIWGEALVDPRATELSEEQIAVVLAQRGDRFPTLFPAQLRGFGPETFLLTEDGTQDWYQVVATFNNCGGFSQGDYVTNACNTWPILAEEVLRLRREKKDLTRRLDEAERERDDWEGMAEEAMQDLDDDIASGDLPEDLEDLLDARLREFSEASIECMRVTGATFVSLDDLRAWWAQGKPDRPALHVVVEEPSLIAMLGDQDEPPRMVCRRCGHEPDKFDANGWCPKGRP
jgi:hypothetical protein